MVNPNKNIRKYFFDTLNNASVSGQQIPCFDSRQATENHNICFLMLDQNNERQKESKCNLATTQNLTIEVIERVQRFGNTGSRVLLDDATQIVYNAFDNINISGFFISEKSLNDQSLATYDQSEILNRNIITLTFKIE